MRTPFPLQWPDGWRQTPDGERQPAKFRLGFVDSLNSLLDELDCLHAQNVVITSDLPTRADGLPYASRKSSGSPGIAVWFTLRDQERVFACDRWTEPADNIRAIALSINALRGMERWGASDVVARAFSGFAALPPASHSHSACWTTLGVDCTGDLSAMIERARHVHRQAIKTAHPDVGGDHARAATLNAAMDAAELEYELWRTQGDRQSR